MLRRGLIMALVLNLVALVPVPLSACAILSGLDGQCQCPVTKECGRSAQTAARNSGPVISCLCVQSEAPFPQAVQSAINPAPIVLAVNFVLPAAPDPLASRAALTSMLAASDLAPPGGQARLCVFLI
jgi:hypothetical protein